MGKIVQALFVAISLFPISALAKGDGVGLWMEGTGSNVRAEGEGIHLRLVGRFWFEQYRGRTERSVVEVDGGRGLSATVSQGQPFFAMSRDWHAGAIREKGRLFSILEVAAQRGRVVRFELADARVAFGRDGSFAVLEGGIVRVTDEDLR